MRNFVNSRAGGLKPSGIRKFFDIVSEMKDAISLGVGEPDFVTPWQIREAGIRSIRRGYTQYTGNRGLPALRERIARYMEERFGAAYPPEHIIVTVGASEGIDLVMRAVCEEGDEILIPDPGYVSYVPCVQLAGGTPVTVRCAVGVRWVPISSGMRYWRSAVQKWLLTVQAAQEKYPPEIMAAPSSSASAMVEQAPYTPKKGSLSWRAAKLAETIWFKRSPPIRQSTRLMGISSF